MANARHGKRSAKITTLDSTNPKDLVGLLKPMIHLVPPVVLIYLALGFEDGKPKYGPFNWREKKVRWTVYYAAAMRHLTSAFDGEEIDPKSKVPHLAHALSCIAILVDAKSIGNLIDDRPPPGKMAELIIQYTKDSSNAVGHTKTRKRTRRRPVRVGGKGPRRRVAGGSDRTR